MFDNTSLEQFSLLDDFPSATPVWRPFVQQAKRTQAVAEETKQEMEERAQCA
ncbi:hypothetical protein AWB79_03165 [Caballeronia hypogeia]|uniref:Uncharacterized protein n=1 Tax=Caballeronia hypogeia TaxID=1777140 RepID=A0A158B4A8_9BURK|nr:hypothetical protein [Caballeronia hypogeia]SAK64915.1 hypothetical protein AWB79_03165 [Caballeronia hypogeia]